MINSLGILKREGEERGAEPGHDLKAADFDEHVAFYRGALRVTKIFLAHVVVLLVAMYFFLVR